MADQVGQRRGHQATDGGEQHQALVNIASMPIADRGPPPSELEASLFFMFERSK